MIFLKKIYEQSNEHRCFEGIRMKYREEKILNAE